MDMRHLNLTFGTVIFLCVTYVSFNHSIQLFHIGGYLGTMAIAGVVAGETLYAMGIINTVYSLMTKTPAPTSARIATIIGTLMVGWANIYDGWELWKAEKNPVGIIIGIAIMTYLWVADGIIVETLSNFFKKTSTQPETSPAHTTQVGATNQEGTTNTNQPIEVKPTTNNTTNTNNNTTNTSSNNTDDSITDDNTDTGNANNTDNDVVGSDNNTMNTNNNDDDNDALNDDNNKADRNNDNQQRQQQENQQQQGNSVVEGDNDTLNDDTNTVNRNDDNLQQHDNHNNTLNDNTNNQQHGDTDNNDSNNHDNNDNMKKHNTNNKAKTNDNNKAETNNDNNKRAKVVDMSERRKKRKELDPDTVIAIYLAEGSNAQIGKQFGVSAEAVRKIKLGQRHAEVTAPYRQAK